MGNFLWSQLMPILLLAGVMTKAGGSIPSPELTGPNMAYAKSTVMFECKLPALLSPLTYELIKGNGDVVDTKDDQPGGHPVTFSLKVNERSEGKYYCRVRARGQTSTSNTLTLQVVIPVQGTHLTSNPDPPVIYEGAGFTLYCQVRLGTHLAYTWYHNKQEVTLPSPLHHLSGNMLTVHRASERHAGYYACMASNKMGNISRYSSSTEVIVVVKKYLSAPRLSFTLYSHDSEYHANISCRSEQGSPPVNFQLLLDGKDVSVQQVGSLEAWFTLPVTVGLDMGTMQCRAETDIQQLLSEPVDLVVVPVGGRAHVVVEYLQTANAVVVAALLQCVVTKGTFPLFSWSFNHSSLPLEGQSHALTSHGRFLVLTDLNAQNWGYYSCKARDSFSSTAVWLESEEVLVKSTDLGITSVEIIAIVFCCFLLVILVAAACCVFWIIKYEEDLDSAIDQDEDCWEQTDTETVGVMLETRPEPWVEEVVVMEAEV